MTREEAKIIIGNIPIYGDDCYTIPEYQEAKAKAIEALEEQQWKVASKKLPEYHESVLTWDGVCYSVEKRIPYICDDDGEHIESDWWVSDDYDEKESEYYPNLRDGTCIAWMRFPKYTEDNDG